MYFYVVIYLTKLIKINWNDDVDKEIPEKYQCGTNVRRKDCIDFLIHMDTLVILVSPVSF